MVRIAHSSFIVLAVGFAIASGACTKSYPVLERDWTLRVSPAQGLKVGDSVEVDVVGDGAVVENSKEIVAALLRIQPDGVLERVSDYTFRAVGAGVVELTLDAKRPTQASVQLEVACPTVRTDIQVVHDTDIAGNASWSADQGVHRVTGLVHVDSGTLTIGACTTVEFGPGAGLVIGQTAPAALSVRGTREHPVLMRGQDGQDWQGIRLYVARAEGSVLRWATLEDAAGLDDGSGGERPALDFVGSPDHLYTHVPITLSGLHVNGCGDVGIRLRNTLATANLSWTENAISGCAGYAISVDAASLGAVPGGSFSGNGSDAVKCVGGKMGANYQLWRNIGVPYDVFSSIMMVADGHPVVAPSIAHLGNIYAIVEAGVRVRFMSADAGLFIGGDPSAVPTEPPATHVRFVTRGTLSKPVHFTSGQQAPAAGDWIGIVFLPGAQLNQSAAQFGTDFMSQLRNTVVEYAGAPSGLTDPADGVTPVQGGVVVYPAMRNLDDKTWLLEGCLVRRNKGYGWVSFTNPVSPSNLSANRTKGLPTCVCDNELGSVNGENPAPKACTACTGKGTVSGD